MLSLVVPLLNEQENLPVLYERVAAAMAQLGPFELLLATPGRQTLASHRSAYLSARSH